MGTRKNISIGVDACISDGYIYINAAEHRSARPWKGPPLASHRDKGDHG
ncbi:hypothetical protein FBPa19_0033 [Pseudomonas phage vB_PaeP_FBPa19]|nr:hypothetical protein FBPa19_0033 [Pseudomonas phage vB_PaeP_FBPa19]